MFESKDYVYEVYRERSFSRAASRLYISQPSLSAKIKKIEDSLGAQIFDRSTSPLRLTEFGKKYIRAIEQIRAIENQIENEIEDMTSLRQGELSIGASNVFSAFVLPPMIAEFRHRFPNVKIRLIEGNTKSLEEMLTSGEVDMVLDNFRYDEELFERKKYTVEHILLAVPKSLCVPMSAAEYEISEKEIKNKDYLKADFKTVPLEIFRDLPFILLTPNNDTRTRGERMCREAGFRPKIAIEVHQQATAYMISATKMGATFVSNTVVEKLPSFENLSYYKLSGPDAERTVYFTMKKHKIKTRAVEEFLKLV